MGTRRFLVLLENAPLVGGLTCRHRTRTRAIRQGTLLCTWPNGSNAGSGDGEKLTAVEKSPAVEKWPVVEKSPAVEKSSAVQAEREKFQRFLMELRGDAGGGGEVAGGEDST